MSDHYENALRAELDAANERAANAERERDAAYKALREIGDTLQDANLDQGERAAYSLDTYEKWARVAIPADKSDEWLPKLGDRVTIKSPFRESVNNKSGYIQAIWEDTYRPTLFRVRFDDEKWAEFDLRELKPAE